MFKKPANSKQSAPIRSSDCRKFRADICQRFNIETPEDGLLLVPDGLHNAKFYTHGCDQGVVYLDPSTGDPLWFTLGKDPAPIPTVYTLWKRHLLPCLSTPAPALERIQGGADLMIPGVTAVSYNLPGKLPSLPANSLIAISKHGSTVPLAVGKLLLPIDHLIKGLTSEEELKGKAVQVLTVYQDCLWETGSKKEPPVSLPDICQLLESNSAEEASQRGPEEIDAEAPDGNEQGLTNAVETLKLDGPQDVPDLIPEDMDANIHAALLQSLSLISKQPSESSPLPLPASTFLTAYLQPSRPQHTPSLDLKKSSHKNLTKLLKTAEKDGLVKVKEIKSVLTIMSIEANHPQIVGHRAFKTAGEADAKEKAKKESEKAAESAVSVLAVEEFWKPSGTVVALFEEAGRDSTALYPAQEVRAIVNDYIASHSLVHPREPTYIVADDLLKNVLRKKDGDLVEFVRRDEIVKEVLGRMQIWHSVGDGKPKKGELKPIHVTVKVRNGRKAVTIVIGFEEYSISPDFLEEELRTRCASSSSSGLIPGQAKDGKAMEVMVQGKHLAPVRELLMAQGVPKRLIVESDPTASKKKK